jgi:hypothetical protein
MKRLHAIVTLLLAAAAGAAGQNLPDRTVVLDPLGAHRSDTAPITWLGAARLIGEFSRYSNGSGPDHRWSARTGGYAEIVRWDSTTSVAFTGMMEVIVDPFSSIGFNPRAIFWEEGILASRRLGATTALQLGFSHRCKHDIDNLEAAVLHGVIEQRTLIYSSMMARLLARPRAVIDGPIALDAGAALRNDYFLYLTDDRLPAPQAGADPGITRLLNSTSLTARIALRPAAWGAMLHLEGSFMLSLFGASQDHRSRDVAALGSFPFLELGLDFFNREGAAATLFMRGEWQRDAAIIPDPHPARLFMMGIRLSGYGDMW